MPSNRSTSGTDNYVAAMKRNQIPSKVKTNSQLEQPGFDPWVGKIPWRRERLPTPVFWPGEFHGLYSCKECQTKRSNFHFHSIYKSTCVSFFLKLFPCKIGELTTFFLILTLYNPAEMYYIWFNTSLLLMDSCLVSSLHNWEQLF